MNTTSYEGINYGLSNTNIDLDTSIRYVVINQNKVGQAWFDESEPYYGKEIEVECPKCNELFTANIEDSEVNCPNCNETILDYEYNDNLEPISYFIKDNEYEADCSCNDQGDIFILKAPYFTYAQFCSPCAPGACHLENPLDHKAESNKCYCFGHDWFDNGKAPYPVYEVETGKLIESEKE